MLVINLKNWFKKSLLISCFIYASMMNTADAENLFLQPAYSKQLSPLYLFLEKQNFSSAYKPNLKLVNTAELSKPYQFLLTQPLMTVGIAQYYQHTPKVRPPLYAENHFAEKIYSRAVIMVIDNNKNRDDALIADKNKESTIVELGLITINFNALSEKMIDGVLHSQVPFGTLLVKNNIKIHNADRSFFSLTCDKNFSKFLNCSLGKTLYGRTNTLIREDNGQWVAHVVEILT